MLAPTYSPLWSLGRHAESRHRTDGTAGGLEQISDSGPPGTNPLPLRETDQGARVGCMDQKTSNGEQATTSRLSAGCCVKTELALAKRHLFMESSPGSSAGWNASGTAAILSECPSIP